MNQRRAVLFIAVGAVTTAARGGGIGSVGDAYLIGDSTGEVYQVTLGGAYVPGNYASDAGSNYFPQNVFSNRSQGLSSPYLTVFGGPNNNFFVFDFFAGIQEIDGNTGAAVFNYLDMVGHRSLDGDFGVDGFLYAAGVGGIWKIDPVNHTGSLVHQTVYGSDTIIEINGDDMFVSGWNATQIVRYSVSNPLMPPVMVTADTFFAVQDLEARVTSHGQELYASALNQGPVRDGIWKYDGMGNFEMFAPAFTVTTPNATGPHGFAFGPDGKLYAAFQNGTVEVFDATSGAFLYTLTDSGAKLTDVTFKPVPGPGSALIVVPGAVALMRRRR